MTYSIDINFLNDRPDYRPDLAKPKRGGGFAAPVDAQRMILVGAVIGLVPLAGVLGFGLIYFLQIRGLEQELAKLDAEITDLAGAVADINKYQAETAQLRTQSQQLASVFDNVRPASALVNDVANRAPDGIHVTTIETVPIDPAVLAQQVAAQQAAAQQAAAPPPAEGGETPPAEGQPAAPAAPAPPPVPPTPPPTIKIGGFANSFETLGDFLISLQRSPFFEASKTRLLDSELKDNTLQVNSVDTTLPPFKLAQVVEFTIETQLIDKPNSELLAQWRANGARGLAVRVTALKEEGLLTSAADSPGGAPITDAPATQEGATPQTPQTTTPQ